MTGAFPVILLFNDISTMRIRKPKNLNVIQMTRDELYHKLLKLIPEDLVDQEVQITFSDGSFLTNHMFSELEANTSPYLNFLVIKDGKYFARSLPCIHVSLIGLTFSAEGK